METKRTYIVIGIEGGSLKYRGKKPSVQKKSSDLERKTEGNLKNCKVQE
ncbi:hypothetical protein PL9631_620013 [Planktothrix paucivesiculata PCC 9631]|uniref:Uncharacterized protein n=1 Tax=Planktothrix paucivesiculata PCC 9631 TaxID=671071 RepID=A0A7Z9BSR1_9CYAN|nr:hypothetical protein PL9631_620013 [Planktothrix paucivesiculata PCC 9631]